jgi:hypothetical protein
MIARIVLRSGMILEFNLLNVRDLVTTAFPSYTGHNIAD